jgi:RNA polymerase sigma-54 factor
MKPSLQLTIGQHLTMTPQLQQAIRLLQLSTLELQSEVQQVLEENPMLELDEENFEASSASENDSAASDKQDAASDNSNDSAAENDDPHLDMENKQEMPDELPVDANWEDTYDITTAAATSPGSQSSNDASNDFLENQSIEGNTLE